MLFSADEIPTDQNPAGQNYYRYENQEVTRWLEESDSVLDEQQRAELLRQVQEQMAQDLPILPMYQRPEYYAYAENLTGPVVNPTLAGPFWNMAEWSWE